MNLKKMINTTLITLGACLFFGVTLISVAGGALYPPINRIAKPFACPNGAMDYGEYTVRPSPGTTVTSITWTCTDARSGEPRDINMWAIVLPAGIIDGLIAFIPVMAIVAAVMIYRASNLPGDPVAQARQEVFNKFGLQQPQYRSSQFVSFPAGSPEGEDRFKEVLSAAESVRTMPGKVTQAAEELSQLKQLLNSGLITQQDYDQKKRDILTRL